VPGVSIMNGFAENTKSNASDKPGHKGAVLSLTTACQMLPLVRGVVKDIVEAQERLSRMNPELNMLDEHRRSLPWPSRSRRYFLTEETALEQRRLQGALAELDSLGVTLLDALVGRVGFPTIVNRQAAYFTWQVGQEQLQHWQFANDSTQRRIPASWWEELNAPLENQE
jgi:hypothetical protein